MNKTQNIYRCDSLSLLRVREYFGHLFLAFNEDEVLANL